jgi:hypothetical protein
MTHRFKKVALVLTIGLLGAACTETPTTSDVETVPQLSRALAARGGTPRVASGIVSSVTKAPITADGDVTGAKTDLVISFDVDPNPAVSGLSLLGGGAIKVTLPAAFVSLGSPIDLPGPPPACPPPAGSCNTGVLLQGWPQNPIPPVPANYTLSLEGTHTIVYTATRDLLPGDPTLNGPGIKQAHLILNGFVNPGPGIYAAHVEAATGSGGAIQTGTATVIIRPRARASINVTSVFAGPPPFPNTIFQQSGTGAQLPIPWNFLVWDKQGAPAVGVTIRQVNENHAQLVNAGKVVGQVSIDGPAGAVGQRVVSQGPSVLVNGPVLGNPTGRLTVDFLAGDLPGAYAVTFRMNNGNSITMHVQAS